ncbi:hypothetical protein [Litoribrevibacter albus]|uniref:Porin domain-containing protein n=1 Tax=Litoribrevibacter albus TaxID=1473156 RepID=A0AA37W6E3_9GAMM|nr:hypothetical protein [Litoribrevibacter albus]GLQ31872.1 hypothetical protein GCM10007876_23510 [Litoribrevibacter albus]
MSAQYHLTRYVLPSVLFIVLLIAICPFSVSANTNSEPSDIQIQYGDDGSCVENELEATEQAVLCIGVELYGSYSHILVENNTEGTDHTLTQFEATPVLQVALPEKHGWSIRGKYEWESTKESSETTAAFVALNHDESGVGFRAGLFEVGGIDQGNEYMTNLGEDATGDYGNIAESQPYLEFSITTFSDLLIALAYSADLDEITTDNQEFIQKASNLNAVLEWGNDSTAIGVEYEYFKYDFYAGEIQSTAPSLDSEMTIGVSMSFDLTEQLTPFFNYGYSELNSEETSSTVKTQEFNLGMDVEVNEQWAFTLGGELIKDDRSLESEKSDDIHNVYGGLHYRLGSSYIGVALWHSDQKEIQDNENITTRVDLELGLVF